LKNGVRRKYRASFLRFLRLKIGDEKRNCLIKRQKETKNKKKRRREFLKPKWSRRKKSVREPNAKTDESSKEPTNDQAAVNNKQSLHQRRRARLNITFSFSGLGGLKRWSDEKFRPRRFPKNAPVGAQGRREAQNFTIFRKISLT